MQMSKNTEAARLKQIIVTSRCKQLILDEIEVIFADGRAIMPRATINQTIKHTSTHTMRSLRAMGISDFKVTALFVPFRPAYRYSSPQDEHETSLTG